MYKIGWFSTGRDKAAKELLKTAWDNIKSGQIPGEISFVFSNREPGEDSESDSFFQMVKDYSIPLICLSSHRFGLREKNTSPYLAGLPPWRRDYDKEVMRLLNPYPRDLCVLAGYMLIVGQEMCQKYTMINLHPATPGGPTGTWQEVVWQLMDSRAETTGVMMHLVTPELDQGPPVTYCTFSIRGQPFSRYWKELEGRFMAHIKAEEGESNPLFQAIRQKGLAREFPLIVATLQAFAQGKVRVEEGKVLDAQGRPIAGYDLTPVIEAKIKENL
ncbi:MAG: phosphoglycerate transporter [Chloroflexi bacterium]|nr:phosphoglycerate transporter [Chloroflexota bacterium]